MLTNIMYLICTIGYMLSVRRSFYRDCHCLVELHLFVLGSCSLDYYYSLYYYYWACDCQLFKNCTLSRLNMQWCK